MRMPVEVLAANLKKWPKGIEYMWQDHDGEWFGNGYGRPILQTKEISSGHRPFAEEDPESGNNYVMVVTRAQWEAERARIAELDRGQYSLMTEEAEDWRNNCQKQYEQELWDKVALDAQRMIFEAADDNEPLSDIASRVGLWADAFMAERAKRLKGVK